MAHISIIGTGNMGQAISAVVTKGDNTVELLGKNDTDKTVTGDIVVLAVPYPTVDQVLAQRAGQFDDKIVVDITNPTELRDPRLPDRSRRLVGRRGGRRKAAELAGAQSVQHHLRRYPHQGNRRPVDHHRADRRRRRRRQGRPRQSGHRRRAG